MENLQLTPDLVREYEKDYCAFDPVGKGKLWADIESWTDNWAVCHKLPIPERLKLQGYAFGLYLYENPNITR